MGKFDCGSYFFTSDYEKVTKKVKLLFKILKGRKGDIIMVKAIIGSTTERAEVITDLDTTVRELLNGQNISTTGHVVNLNMKVLSQAELDKTLGELGVPDESTASLICCVKAESAR